MCHLILLMPVLALPVFWLVPLEYALPTYVLIVLMSGLLYWLIGKAMGRQPETGAESLIGAVAEVVSRLGSGDHARYLVRSRGRAMERRFSAGPQGGGNSEYFSGGRDTPDGAPEGQSQRIN